VLLCDGQLNRQVKRQARTDLVAFRGPVQDGKGRG
jgi:hypothetical protein